MAEYDIVTEEEYEFDKLAVQEGRLTVDAFVKKYPRDVQRFMNDHSPTFNKPIASKHYAEKNGMVDKYEEMDPRHDGFLFSGEDLMDGMVVLAEIPMRVDITQQLDPEGFYLARLYNRWFQVSNLSVVHANITLQANYEDGTKARLSLSIHHAWIFKLGTDRATGKAQVPGQTILDPESAVQDELNRLRKEDFGG